jgi:hypothetical protein
MTRLLLLAALLLPTTAAAQGLSRAHAHNDYEHARPLLDALERGFDSVEADVHLVDGALLVGHDAADLRPERTLEALYLAPLRDWVRAHGGVVQPGLPPLLLLVDVKTDAEPTYAALHALLRRYADLLTIHAGDAVAPGPVTAVVSGNRSLPTMRAQPVRFAAYDGRAPELTGPASALPPSLMPLVSESWDRVSRWTGDGPIPDADRRDVERLVRLAHDQHRRLRFWGTPDREPVWRFLYESGVDLINTDDLEGLSGFLRGKREGHGSSVIGYQ